MSRAILLLAVLIEVVKEQQEQIEAQQVAIQALRARVEGMEKQRPATSDQRSLDLTPLPSPCGRGAGG